MADQPSWNRDDFANLLAQLKGEGDDRVKKKYPEVRDKLIELGFTCNFDFNFNFNFNFDFNFTFKLSSTST